MRKTVVADLMKVYAGSGPVLSIFLDTDRSRRTPKEISIEVKNILKEAVSVCRESVLEGAGNPLAEVVERLIPHIEGVIEDMPRGWAFYINLKEGLLKEVGLPVSVRPSVYLRHKPYLHPLLQALAPFKRSLVVEVEHKRVRLFDFNDGRIKLIEEIEEDVPQKVKTGGWYGLEERRIERHVEQHVLDYLKKVSAYVRSIAEEYPFKLMLIGGNIEYAQIFKDLLDGLISIDMEIYEEFGETADINQVFEMVLKYSMNRFWNEGEEAVNDIINNLGNTKMAVAGLRGVIKALNYGAVYRLVEGEYYEKNGKYCPKCEALGIDEEECPNCSSKMVDTQDLLEEMVHKAFSQDADILLLNRPTQLRQYEGIGARLRFKI